MEKTILINLLEFTFTTERHFTGNLSLKARQKVGSENLWSAKDEIVHITAWRESLSQNLADIFSGRVPYRSDDYDQTNSDIFHQHKMEPWDRVEKWFQTVQLEFIHQVQQIDQETLNRRDVFPWQGDRGLWQMITGYSVIHSFTHIAFFLVRNQQPSKAIEYYSKGADYMLGLEDLPTWKGMILYDQACVLAQAGVADRAIHLLRSALEYSPELKDWSQEDPDLSSLHELKDFQDLYAN